MVLNLLSDPWIPVLRNGETIVIRPDQIGESGVCALAWPRADFNLASLELLIGLVSIADPPRDDADWLGRLNWPDTDRFREALEPFVPYFELAGNGPRFLQDLEALECTAKCNSLDMLYIDSAFTKTIANNADLMVKRGRSTSLPPAEAAMALYTLQTFAPSGGKGNRTSMRGGGPMTTLVQPTLDDDKRFPLWRLVLANVLPGTPLAAEDAKQALPWLRETQTSEKGQIVTQADASHRFEAFFGMPRRLRLLFEDGRAVSVVQRPYGTNYATWEHPLTPYYRRKEDDPEWLPVRLKAGRLSYRNWLGVTMKASRSDKGGTKRMAEAVRTYTSRPQAPDYGLLVGGWAMDNMKPVDFSLHKYPGFPRLNEDNIDRVHQLVEAAGIASRTLRKRLKAACQLDGTSANAVVETLFAETEEKFQALVGRIVKAEGKAVEEEWYRTLFSKARYLFDERVVGDLSEMTVAAIEKRVMAQRKLCAELNKLIRKELELPLPDKSKRRI